MILPVTIFFLAVVYLCYKTKENVSMVKVGQLEKNKEKIEEDPLHKDLEDLFI